MSLFEKPSPMNEGDNRNKTGEVTVKKSRVGEWIARIGSLLLAFILWLIVMATDSPTSQGEFARVPIRIENNTELSILAGDDLTIDLTVEGKRSVIAKASAEEIDAYVIVDPGTEPGKHTFDVQLALPGGLTLASQSLSRVSLYLDNTTSVSVPVRVKLADYVLEDNYELGESDITTDIKTVKVTGPEALLGTIDAANVTLSLGHVTRSVTCSAPFTLVDAGGEEVSSPYMRVSEKEVLVTVPVYKYRLLPLRVTGKYGFYNEENAVIEVTPPAIRIKGDADAVDSADWSYMLDEKMIASDRTYNVAVTLPDSVINADGVTSATISVKHIGTVTKTVIVDQFEVINPSGLVYEIEQPSIQIAVRGSEALLRYLSSASIHAVVDLTSRKAGSVLVPVTFTFDGPYDGAVYEIGTYSITVKIS